MGNIFQGLNQVQKEAVETTEGPLLVLAGAGTGKTKVLTSRIVHILTEKKASLTEVLAVTFTNKAANEMKERVAYMIGYPVDNMWIGTFHSIGLRILRRHHKEVGLKPNFNILDTSDCERLMKDILLELNIDIKQIPPKYVLHSISKIKDKNIMPQNVPAEHEQMFSNTSLSKIYNIYQTRLRELNSVDFSDLILLCIDLFKQFPDILVYWQGKFKYVLVDEYQDTNALQYIFVRILALKYNNICCVGDDDQSIYSWRGADINNILRFSQDFENAKVMRLEQNYRSTNEILTAASLLISNNDKRWGKKLWTNNNQDNKKIQLLENYDGRQEADAVANLISEKKQNGHQYNDMAILVRSSFQTRQIEDGLNKQRIPYKVIGGVKFYDRQEIKDTIAYLRVFYQDYDDLAFRRIINNPKRGVGETSLDKLRYFAREEGMSLINASRVIVGKKIVSSRVEKVLESFIDSLDNLRKDLPDYDLKKITEGVLEEFGYIQMLEAENTPESKNRLENIKELYTELNNYSSLEEFLDHISLVMEKEDNTDTKYVSIMTIHAAKGLEFNTVFLVGMEDGNFPNARSLDETGDIGLQEERRLAYVAITRAKKELYLSYANNRQLYGNWQNCIASRFIEEIGEENLEKVQMNNNFGFQFSAKQSTQYDNLEEKLKQLGISMGKNNNSNHLQSSFSIGQRVSHMTMGFGVVKDIQGSIVRVDFEDIGIKSIQENYLKPIY